MVTLLAEMLEPYQGKIYDPCCGSGGMFVQSLGLCRAIRAEQGYRHLRSGADQHHLQAGEDEPGGARGLSGNLGERPANATFFDDQHPDLKADFIMANPPFNLKEWRNERRS